jgi:DNA (cytosine-5)-methyltransferase 1
VFESSHLILQPEHPRHTILGSAAGHWTPGRVISVSGNCAPIAEARAAMGIDWMNRSELAESIPPAYTQFVGEQLLQHIAAAVTS